MDRIPPGSSVHGILQARILEWAAMPSSRGPSRHRDQTLVSHVVQIGNIKAENIDYGNLKDTIEKNNVKCGDANAAKLMEELSSLL